MVSIWSYHQNQIKDLMKVKKIVTYIHSCLHADGYNKEQTADQQQSLAIAPAPETGSCCSCNLIPAAGLLFTSTASVPEILCFTWKRPRRVDKLEMRML